MITLNFCSELDGVEQRQFDDAKTAEDAVLAFLGPAPRRGVLNSGAEAWVPRDGESRSVVVAF